MKEIVVRNIFIVVLPLFFLIPETFAQNTFTIKVHFLYGSKPKKEFKESEKKWFGGLLGGHVGIELDSNRILDFIPSGQFHWFQRKQNKHSKFVIHTPKGFAEIFGGVEDSVKRTLIIIPITNQQKEKLDSIYKVYTLEPPYDYAFFGMRCGSATYEILSQLKIVREYSYQETYIKVFYPKKLRRLLLKKAKENNWQIITQEGSTRRRWEKV